MLNQNNQELDSKIPESEDPSNPVTGSNGTGTSGDHFGDGDSSEPIVVPLTDPLANWMVWGPESNHQYIVIKKLYKSGNTYYADIYCMLSDYRLDGGTVEISYENSVDLGDSYSFIPPLDMRDILKDFEQYNIIWDTVLNIFRHKSQTRAELGGTYHYIEDNIVKKGVEDGGNIAYHHFAMHNYFMPCELKHIGVMQTSFKNTPVTLLTGITQ